MESQTRLYVVVDRTTESIGPIIELANDLIAVRQFDELLKKNGYPEDFDMYCIGSVRKVYTDGAAYVSVEKEMFRLIKSGLEDVTAIPLEVVKK